MANKVFNMAGGLHSAAAYSAFEDELYNGNTVASYQALAVSSGTGMQVIINKGNGMIATDNMYSRRIQLDANVTATITAADTSLARIDTVVIYVDNSVATTTSVVDNTNDILKTAVVKGTPAQTPTAPSTATIQSAIGAGNDFMILANVTVPAKATAITASNITDKRPSIAGRGMIGDITISFRAKPAPGRLFMNGGKYQKTDYPLMYDFVRKNPAYGTTTATAFTLTNMSGRAPFGTSSNVSYATLGKKIGYDNPRAPRSVFEKIGTTNLIPKFTGSAFKASAYTWIINQTAQNVPIAGDPLTDGVPGNIPPSIVVNYEVVAS